MKNSMRSVASLLGVGVLAVAVAACGGTPPKDGGDSSISVSYAQGQPAASSSKPWILGTTDSVTSIDPAGAYDIGSWNLEYQMFQQLVSVPADGATPQPDAAKSCTYTDAKTVKCVLQPGLKFSNGDDLTSSDVKYSFQRNIAINDPNGSAILLGAITDSSNENHPKLADGAIDTPNPTTVIFHLNAPDQTFLQVLSSATSSIVDEQVYPPTKELADTDTQVGSGPYTLVQYKDGVQAVFEKNDSYKGPHAGIAPKVFVSYYKSDSALTTDVESGAVDVAWRSMSPAEQQTVSKSGQADMLKGAGSEFRYWVWDFRTDTGKQQAIRQAVAQLIDRSDIASRAYGGTVTPAYSIVPKGFAGQKDSFQTQYGDASVDKAKQILSDAGVQTPVTLKLGYPQEHYGPNAVDEATELVGQLNDSGLFKASAGTEEWEQYQTSYKKDAYDLYMLGWYPDFLDADNYLTPFLHDGGFFANGYKSAEVEKLLGQEIGQTDKAKREAIIGQLQDIVAKDVPLIPSWNGANVAAAGKGMGGVEQTLDPTYIFRFWMITKN